MSSFRSDSRHSVRHPANQRLSTYELQFRTHKPTYNQNGRDFPLEDLSEGDTDNEASASRMSLVQQNTMLSSASDIEVPLRNDNGKYHTWV